VKLAQEPLVIDVKTERLGGGVEIGAVNEQCDFFRFGFHHCSHVRTKATTGGQGGEKASYQRRLGLPLAKISFAAQCRRRGGFANTTS
jgi:hypothetical protein